MLAVMNISLYPSELATRFQHSPNIAPFLLPVDLGAVNEYLIDGGVISTTGVINSLIIMSAATLSQCSLLFISMLISLYLGVVGIALVPQLEGLKR
jgi:hypothetical protein